MEEKEGISEMIGMKTENHLVMTIGVEKNILDIKEEERRIILA
jgi:hypothetical protein